MGSSSASNSPCAACKLRRCKCTHECVFPPYFPPDQPQKFASVHKVFGASNVGKLLSDLPPSQREDAANSLAFEAEARIRDPIYGCVGLIFNLEQQLKHVQLELYNAKKELATYIGPSPMLSLAYPHPHHLQQQQQQQQQYLLRQNPASIASAHLLGSISGVSSLGLGLPGDGGGGAAADPSQVSLRERQQQQPQQMLEAQGQQMGAVMGGREQESADMLLRNNYEPAQEIVRYNPAAGTAFDAGARTVGISTSTGHGDGDGDGFNHHHNIINSSSGGLSSPLMPGLVPFDISSFPVAPVGQQAVVLHDDQDYHQNMLDMHRHDDHDQQPRDNYDHNHLPADQRHQHEVVLQQQQQQVVAEIIHNNSELIADQDSRDVITYNGGGVGSSSSS